MDETSPSMFPDLNPPYATIVADPPWKYEGRGQVGTGGRGAEFVMDFPSAGASDKYDTMPMDDLRAMPVKAIAAKNAHLWLWTTNAFMGEAWALAQEWGFTPKTILTWGKVKADGTPSMKTGYYLRGATEHAVFATRGGGIPKPAIATPTLLLTPRIGQHSRKPDEFFDVVERVSPGPRVELFARRRRGGWDSWGNQIDGEGGVS